MLYRAVPPLEELDCKELFVSIVITNEQRTDLIQNETLPYHERKGNLTVSSHSIDREVVVVETTFPLSSTESGIYKDISNYILEWSKILKNQFSIVTYIP